eukprot:15449639-Alexandrium_andersonii.AAC.1
MDDPPGRQDHNRGPPSRAERQGHTPIQGGLQGPIRMEHPGEVRKDRNHVGVPGSGPAAGREQRAA